VSLRARRYLGLVEFRDGANVLMSTSTVFIDQRGYFASGRSSAIAARQAGNLTATGRAVWRGP
jgi:hypothetical protein